MSITNKEKRDLLLAGAAKFDWRAENPKAGLGKWPGFKESGPLKNDCQCCEITVKETGGRDCHACPIIWDSNLDADWADWDELPCCTKNSPYTRGAYARDSSSFKIASHYFSICAELHREAAAKIPVEKENPLLGEWCAAGIVVYLNEERRTTTIAARSEGPGMKHWPKVRQFIVRAKKFVEKWAEPFSREEHNRRVHVTAGGFFFDPEARDILAGLEE